MTMASTDVLFLQPPSPPGTNVLRDYAGGFGVSQRYAGGQRASQPYLSLVYAFSAARDSVPSLFVDAQAQGLTMASLAAAAELWAPRVIVSVLSLPSLASDLACLAELKRRTGAAVVGAGTVCRVLTRDVLAGGVVDAAVTGDPEVVVARLLDPLLSGRSADGVPGVARSGEGMPRAAAGGLLTDLDALPLPAFEALPLERYRTWEFGRARRIAGRGYGPWARYFPLYFSRGCPFGCDYCPYPVGFGERCRRRSPERVVEEFRAASAHGVRNVILRDQVVSADPRHLAAVCDALVDSGVRMRWLCEARLGSLDAKLLRRMRRAGCVRVHYGVETGDPALFAGAAKRGIAYGSIATSLQRTADAGITPSVHLLLGFPGEDWASVERTAALVRRLGIADGDCSVMTPYPGTAAYGEAAAEGRIVAGGWSDFTGDNPVLRLDGLSSVELALARRYLLRTIAANKRVTMRGRLRALRGALRPEPGREAEQLRALVECDRWSRRDGRPADAASREGPA